MIFSDLENTRFLGSEYKYKPKDNLENTTTEQ
jgi:hypothetical protein